MVKCPKLSIVFKSLHPFSLPKSNLKEICGVGSVIIGRNVHDIVLRQVIVMTHDTLLHTDVIKASHSHELVDQVGLIKRRLKLWIKSCV